jgi:MFS family permease
MSDAQLFKNRSFFRLWSGQLLSTFAFQMLSVGIGWQMYDLTDSALSLGLVGLAQFLPQLILTLWVGHVADQYNRLKIILCCRTLMAVTVGSIAYANAVDLLTPHLIYACAVALGVSRAFEMPALQALTPNLVKSHQLSSAMAMMASAREAMVIAGPAVGGLVYLLGAPFLYGFSTACFLLSIAFLAGIDYQHNVKAKTPLTLDYLLGGLRYIRKNSIIMGSISLDMFAVLLGGATALLPIVAKDLLQTDAWGLGLLRSAPAIGAVLMSVYLARRPLRRRVGSIMLWAVGVFGASTIVFGLSTNLYLSLGALAILGASDMVSVVIRSTLVQLETPDEMRGRVSAANSVFIGSSNQLGEFESGATAALFGTVPAIVLGGAGTLLVVGLWAWKFPTLRQRDTMESNNQ